MLVQQYAIVNKLILISWGLEKVNKIHYLPLKIIKKLQLQYCIYPRGQGLLTLTLLYPGTIEPTQLGKQVYNTRQTGATASWTPEKSKNHQNK